MGEPIALSVPVRVPVGLLAHDGSIVGIFDADPGELQSVAVYAGRLFVLADNVPDGAIFEEIEPWLIADERITPADRFRAQILNFPSAEERRNRQGKEMLDE